MTRENRPEITVEAFCDSFRIGARVATYEEPRLNSYLGLIDFQNLVGFST